MPLHDDEIAVGITHADAETGAWINPDGWGWRRPEEDAEAFAREMQQHIMEGARKAAEARQQAVPLAIPILR